MRLEIPAPLLGSLTGKSQSSVGEGAENSDASYNVYRLEAGAAVCTISLFAARIVRRWALLERGVADEIVACMTVYDADGSNWFGTEE